MDKTKLIVGILGITILAGAAGYVAVYRQHGTSVSTSTKVSTAQNTQTTTVSATNLLTGDTCSQFSKEFVASAIGQPVLRTESYAHSTNHGCQYFISETNKNMMVEIDVNTGNTDNEKTVAEYLKWKVEKDDRIPMDNFLVWQEGNILNKQFLIIDANDYIMITRTAADVLDNDKMIAFTAAVARQLQQGGVGKQSEATARPTKSVTVPLPKDSDIVKSFITLIGEHRPSDAVSMLSPDEVSDDSKKQAWAVQFNAFSSLKVTSVEPALQDSWTDTQHEYKVVLTAAMKPESASAPIPYYGWENGTNTRWITMVKSGNLWKVETIATGP